MTTLAVLRAKLNDEVGVASDAETSPWTTTQRNAAICDGYADLWRVGVWKDAKQDLSSVSDTWAYELTSIRRLYRIELIDSTGRVLEHPRGIVEPDFTGSNAWRLRLQNPVSTGYTMRVLGWTPYKSTMSSDGDADDLPAEHNRIPLLKAKAILYRQAISRFMRWGEAQSIVPPMNVSLDGLFGGVAQAEREYEEAARELAGLRPRATQSRSV